MRGCRDQAECLAGSRGRGPLAALRGRIPTSGLRVRMDRNCRPAAARRPGFAAGLCRDVRPRSPRSERFAGQLPLVMGVPCARRAGRLPGVEAGECTGRRPGRRFAQRPVFSTAATRTIQPRLPRRWSNRRVDPNGLRHGKGGAGRIPGNGAARRGRGGCRRLFARRSSLPGKR